MTATTPFLTARVRPFVRPETLVDTSAMLLTLTDRLAAGEAVYRAERDLMNLHLDAHRDAALAKLGYI